METSSQKMNEEPINRLTEADLLVCIAKLLENLVEDTVEGVESLKRGHEALKMQSAIDEMDEKSTSINETRLKTMFKVLHNVPLISYKELESKGFIYPLIQMQVLQQQVFNLCGYHMSHSLMNFVNYLKSVGSTSFLENINSSTRYASLT